MLSFRFHLTNTYFKYIVSRFNSSVFIIITSLLQFKRFPFSSDNSRFLCLGFVPRYKSESNKRCNICMKRDNIKTNLNSKRSSSQDV